MKSTKQNEMEIEEEISLIDNPKDRIRSKNKGKGYVKPCPMTGFRNLKS